ncbi:hypothetical protein C8R46DRAFT_1353816 [Mycena filopes]|nr:hypothetical protein C8R46DRAFT_1353816 [Mycena filopes]
MKVLAHSPSVPPYLLTLSFLGPGPKPASLTDPSVFTRRADLRDFGVRRASMYHALCAQALRLACEVGILLEPSEDNAVSCFILQFLENEKNLRSRPWAVAHLSHIRAISESWGPSRVLSEYTLSVWTSLLLLEVLEATHCRRPILVSHYDQLLLTGIGPPSLEIYVASVQSLVADRKQAKLQLLFTIVQPFLFHATELARKLYETITGDFARRHPVDETAVTQLISALNLLHSIPVLLSEEGALDAHFSESLFCPSAETRDAHINMRAAAHIMTFSHASLVLALYRELEHRARDTAPLPVHDGEAPPDHWRAERLALLRRQVRDMAGRTVHEVARGLRALPSLPHIAHIQRGALVAWAEFCLDDPTVTPERAAMMETLSGALKLIGYAWPLPPGLVERLDAASGPALIEDVAATNASFLDMFPAPLDDNWMSMFTMPLGSGGFPEGQFL